jgi:hypothetical protein
MTTNPPPNETGKGADTKEKGEARDENWIETVEHEIEDIIDQPAPVLFLRIVMLDLPYIVMLSMAILGIGYVTFTGEPTPYYWGLLAPLYCAICIFAGWRHAEDKSARIALVWTQALHWLATLVAMYLIYLPQVRDVANNNAAGLSLMCVLALATFLAGVHAKAWQICVVGAILAIAVPAIAWIQQSSLLIVVVFLGLLFVGATLWSTTYREKRRGANSDADSPK